MVSSLIVDSLNSPAQILLELWETCKDVDTFPDAVSDHFSQIFAKRDTFQEISCLSIRRPPSVQSSRSLVRFRAMVQDTSSSPEMYIAKTRSGSCNGWGIVQETEDITPIDYNNLRECFVLWATSVPGETAWCSSELDGVEDTHSGTFTPIRPHKFAVAEGNHVSAQVKIYSRKIYEDIKTTDVLTFVGILTSELSSAEAESDDEVPTLHVLYTVPERTTLVSRPYSMGSPGLSRTREKLIAWIASEALGGDNDAAEWVLLTVISRVQSRNPPILPISLTIAGFGPPPAGKMPALTHIISELVPVLVTVPLTLHLLNEQAFAPESKDEDLHSGFLQVPQGSTMLITESGVREGKVAERGIMNLRAVQEAISSQSLSYNFPYSSFTFPTDISFIVLSEGRKSAFFQTSITIPLKSEGAEALYRERDEIAMPTADELAEFRDLIIGAKTGNVAVTDALADYVQDDFVKQRQNDKTVSTDDLIHRMTVAKWMALSQHEVGVTVDIWERVRELDNRRKTRLV